MRLGISYKGGNFWLYSKILQNCGCKSYMSIQKLLNNCGCNCTTSKYKPECFVCKIAESVRTFFFQLIRLHFFKNQVFQIMMHNYIESISTTICNQLVIDFNHKLQGKMFCVQIFCRRQDNLFQSIKLTFLKQILLIYLHTAMPDENSTLIKQVPPTY